MLNYQTREQLKMGPLAPLYASVRRLKRAWRSGPPETPLIATWDAVVRPDPAALEQAIRDRPQEPRLHFTLGLDLLERGEPQQALAALEQCARLHFEAEERLALHRARALALLGRGDEAKALIAPLGDDDLTRAEIALRDQVRAVTGEH